MQASADPAEAVLPGDVTSHPAVHSRDESAHLLIAWANDLPRNAARRPSSLELFRSGESTNVAPSAVDLSIPSEEAQEEQFSPPEVTPSHLREIDHVWHLLLDPHFH